MFYQDEEHKPSGTVLDLADNVGLELDYEARVMRVLKRVTFHDGFRPPKTHQGWKLEVEVRSEAEEQACVVDGTLLSDLLNVAGDDVFVAVGYFWRDVATA